MAILRLMAVAAVLAVGCAPELPDCSRFTPGTAGACFGGAVATDVASGKDAGADTPLATLCDGTNCDDGNVCTNDFCDKTLGCQHANNTIQCEDGSGCTTGDKCGDGSCKSATAINCDDGNLCTDDSCDAKLGCLHLGNEVACDDLDACTLGDKCGGGLCIGGMGVGKTLNCDDLKDCTTDSCSPASGCVHTNNTTGCSDGNACTSGDACSGGGCKGSSVSCDDGEVCTTDSCAPASGCVHTNNTTGCSDGNACTSGDACSGGGCKGAPVNCDDGNACTTDSCNASSGCKHATAGAGTTCGTGKVCNASGSCVSPPPPGTEIMVLIPAGTFWMGCNSAKDTNCQSNESPQHKVTLSSYYMDVNEVTVGQYKACVDAGVCTAPSAVQPSQYATYPGLTNNPVNYVSWTQSQQYCQWRGAGYDLPTEAQWEMAARGDCVKNGKTAEDPTCAQAMRTYPWGEATATCSHAVMYDGANDGCGTKATWAVGSKTAGDSPYGLHDMAGNVWEWNRDWYAAYGSNDQTDPAGPGSASYRVGRGGSFPYDASGLRAGLRSYYTPSYAYDILGLRCSRSFP